MIAHDRRIAGITEALDRSRSPTVARSLKSVSIYIIADDHPIDEKCFHIITDDRWHDAGSIFSDPAIVSYHMETRLY